MEPQCPIAEQHGSAAADGSHVAKSVVALLRVLMSRRSVVHRPSARGVMCASATRLPCATRGLLYWPDVLPMRTISKRKTNTVQHVLDANGHAALLVGYRIEMPRRRGDGGTPRERLSKRRVSSASSSRDVNIRPPTVPLLVRTSCELRGVHKLQNCRQCRVWRTSCRAELQVFARKSVITRARRDSFH